MSQSVVPVEPLFLNLLGQHVVQCQLHGEHTLPGQRSNSWNTFLEAISSYVSPSKLPHTTLQFIRYSTLLENARRMENGKLDQETSVQVFALVTQLYSSPELFSIQEKLSPLVKESITTLDTRINASESDVKRFSKMVFDFVGAAMTCYDKLPVEEVFVVKEVAPRPRKSKRERKHRVKETPPQKITKSEHKVSQSNPVDAMSVISSKESSSDLVKGNKEILLTTLPTSKESDTTVDGEMNSHPSKESVDGEMNSRPSKESIDGEMNSLPSKESDTNIDGEVDRGKALCEDGKTEMTLTDTSRGSGTEMEWSSDESTLVLSVQLPKKTAIQSPPQLLSDSSPSLFDKPLIKKGSWSEEESRCLTEGVKIIGEGKWKEIIAQYPTLRCRTSNQLKDRYRNIKGRSK